MLSCYSLSPKYATPYEEDCAMKVYNTLCNMAHSDGTVTIRIKDLAEEADVSYNAARVARKTLEANGLLESHQAFNGPHGITPFIFRPLAGCVCCDSDTTAVPDFIDINTSVASLRQLAKQLGMSLKIAFEQY